MATSGAAAAAGTASSARKTTGSSRRMGAILCALAPERRVLLPQFGGRAALVEVLAGDRVPVGAGAQLAERREHEPLHAPDEQGLRRQRHLAHVLEVGRARR